MKIRQMLAPYGTAARCGYSLQPEYITLHNTANLRPSATAAAHGRYLQGAGSMKEVSYHYVVDDKEIVRCIPDNEVAWHAGDTGKGPGNRKSIAIEICENEGGNLYNATQNAAWLAAFLMREYNIPLKNVVQHNHWSQKNCPNRIRKGEPYGWAEFLTNVSREFDLAQEQETAQEIQLKEQIAQKTQRIMVLEQVLEKVKAAVSKAEPLTSQPTGGTI
ncbi:MAG: N-acetylmuramoyl-L-alanine amidase [Oscillospiraceae bacterium]